jgi:hypothetical protein
MNIYYEILVLSLILSIGLIYLGINIYHFMKVPVNNESDISKKPERNIYNSDSPMGTQEEKIKKIIIKILINFFSCLVISAFLIQAIVFNYYSSPGPTANQLSGINEDGVRNINQGAHNLLIALIVMGFIGFFLYELKNYFGEKSKSKV